MSLITNVLQIVWNIIGLDKVVQNTSNSSADTADTTTNADSDSGDYGADTCVKLTKAVNDFLKDASNSPDLLTASFHGGRNIDSPPVIILVFKDTKKTNRELANTYTTKLNGVLNTNFKTTTKAIAQLGSRFHSLTPYDLKSIADADKADSKTSKAVVDHHSRPHIPFELTSEEAAELEAASRASTENTPTGTLPEDIPPKNVIPSFSIASYVLDRMLGDTVTDEQVHEVMESIASALSQIGTETEGGAVIARMLAAGIVSIGSQMWEAYLKSMKIDDSYTPPTELIPTLITSAGGVGVVAPLAATISKALSAFLHRPDSAKALLLVINATTCSFKFGGDAIGSGAERDMMTHEIVQGTKRNFVIPCGLYAYGRYTPAVARGPWFGVTLLCSDTDIRPVGVGLSCDNTSIGKYNSVYMVRGGNDLDGTQVASGAATLARITSSAASERVLTLKTPSKSREVTFTGRRCLKWGNYHPTFCFVTEAIST